MSFSTVMIPSGVFLVMCGMFSLFAGNLMWWIQKSNNSAEGQVSDGSGAWEVNRTLRGIVLLIGGIAFIFGGSQFTEQTTLQGIPFRLHLGDNARDTGAG